MMVVKFPPASFVKCGVAMEAGRVPHESTSSVAERGSFHQSSIAKGVGCGDFEYCVDHIQHGSTRTTLPSLAIS